MNRAWIVCGATASAAARIGMPVEEYRRQREAGNRYCSWHGRFEPASAFAARTDSRRTSCPDGHREASRQAKARRRGRPATAPTGVV